MEQTRSNAALQGRRGKANTHNNAANKRQRHPSAEKPNILKYSHSLLPLINLTHITMNANGCAMIRTHHWLGDHGDLPFKPRPSCVCVYCGDCGRSWEHDLVNFRRGFLSSFLHCATSPSGQILNTKHTMDKFVWLSKRKGVKLQQSRQDFQWPWKVLSLLCHLVCFKDN